MDGKENIEEFYQRKYGWMPDNIRNEIGHFNVFRLEPLVKGKSQPLPYRRRDYYKVMLVKGNSKVHFADKVVEVQKQAITFSNPHIPYKWEHLDNLREGCYCIFNKNFFHQYGGLDHYEVFRPNGTHIFELNAEQVEKVQFSYDRIFEEINSEYIHKYDVLRTLVLELIHFAMKMQP